MRLDRAVFLAYVGRWVTALFLVTGLLLAGLLTLVTPQTYSATSRALVSPNSEVLAKTQESGALIAFAQNRAQTYAEVVSSPSVVNPVAARLGIAGSDAEWAEMVSAEVVPGTQLIEIKVRTPKAGQAADFANALAEQITREATRVEQQGAGGTVTIVVTVVQRASPPPSQGKPFVRNLLIGLLLGILVAVLVFLARLAFGQNLTDVDTVIEVTGAPPLASVTKRRSSARPPLVVRDQPRSAAAEDYRRLAASLQFHDTQHPARSVVIAGVTGNSGASTVTANLAVAIAESGRRVVVVDGNLHAPALPRIFGVEASPGFTEALSGALDVETLFRPCGKGQLAVVPPGKLPDNPGALVSSADTAALIQTMMPIADLVLIDAPALLTYSDATSFAAITEGTILVVAYGKVGRGELQGAVDVLDQVHAPLIGTVFFGVPGHRTNARTNASTHVRLAVGPASERS